MRVAITYYHRLPHGGLRVLPGATGADVALVEVDGLDEAQTFELPAQRPQLDFAVAGIMAAHAIGKAAAQEEMRKALGIAVITDIRQIARPKR
ncbi:MULTISPECIES: hypothetical protein [unclassified Bradyrhizobium]|uniref:hypothetical protein n=1 Tax=unclassified Bradyrhizobium TaxID=2631580 RepID=UPI0029166E2C|nr:MULTISPECIES: hypothetical protein [unclassified Bradyrhizobium]